MNQTEPIEVRTTILTSAHVEIVEFDFFPYEHEALSLIAITAHRARLTYGWPAVDYPDNEHVTFRKPNDTIVTLAVVHDLEQYGAP